MSSIKILIQGGAIASSVGGGCFAISSYAIQPNNLSENKASESKDTSIVESKTWLVSSTVDSSSSSSDPLIINEPGEKNYVCMLNSSNKELDCNLYTINYDNDTNLSFFTKTKDSQKEVKAKSELTPNTFFKLKVNSKKLPSFKLDGTETIQLIHKTSKEAYATLTPKFELQEKQIFGDTNLVLGKFPEAITGSTKTTTFKCKLSSEKEFLPCDIYQFRAPINNANQLNFGRVKKTTTANDIQATKYCILDLKSKKINAVSALQTIEITVESNPSPTAQFTVDTPLIGIITSVEAKNKIIFPK